VLKKTTFFMATSDAKTLPQSVAEVVFVGRSNVGKSSVINASCSAKNLARTSKTPGRTRSINVYSIVMRKWLIDLPGYGFARVSPKEKDLWNKMIEECLVERKSKKTVYIVIDAFVGPTELDFDMASWLKEHNINFKIVVNKCDKLPNTISQEEIKNKTTEIFKITPANIFTVSAKKRSGFGKLQLDIIKFLAIK
jgi:GTP-binding protein